ncbi:MAG TPA: class I SAM-dependent methyltransferase [Solirubrobacterales bacterium]|nr:class I SAM-dependent methyltransferase [Solirubrobacterales bacterium]
MAELPEHVSRNRAYWNVLAAEFVADGKLKWSQQEPNWGIWSVPETELGVLPADAEIDGKDTIELGCGTGYVSAWLARRGARPVGIDNSEAQLATARELQAEHGIEFPLLHGNAEQTGLPDASFDLAISEYGASIWCDPYGWIPEAARLLRPGAELIFLVNSVLVILCDADEGEEVPVGNRLARPQFGLRRLEWSDDDSVEFHLPQGEMIDLLGANDLQVERLIEVRPPQDATTRYPFVTLEWARKWPCEEVWRARKR